MPIAKYKRDEKSGLYYTYEKTGFYYPNGKPKYQKLRAKTIARLDEKIKAFKEGQTLSLDISKITVDEWEKQWFNSYKNGCRENTKNFYKSLYRKHIKPKIGMMRITDVKEFHLQAILTGMSETHGVKTVQDVKSLLFGLFDKAVQNRMIPMNPAGRLRAAGKQQKRRRELTEAERKAYLQACKQHEFGTFAALLYFFGLRRGEAAALLGSDIEDSAISVNKQHTFPRNNRPTLGPPKTAAGYREVIIPDVAREYIDFDALRQDKGDAYLFSDGDGNYRAFSSA
jgi:integrase